MSTTYYVDAYNLIHCSEPLKGLARKSIAAARDLLVKLAAEYCTATNDTVVLVFDGMADPATQARYPDRLGSLRIVYCENAMTADTYIGRALFEIKNRLAVVVVTADRAIADSSRGMGALVLKPQSFMNRIEPAISGSRPARKPPEKGRFGVTLAERLSVDTRAGLHSLRGAVASRRSRSGKKGRTKNRRARRAPGS